MPAYEIRTVQDFFAVPASRRREMLAALERWLGQLDPVVAMRDPRSLPMHEAFWWDDTLPVTCESLPRPPRDR